MKKILAVVCILLAGVQTMALAAECSVTVENKSTSGAAVSISGAEEESAVGIWADYDNAGNMLSYKPVDIDFVDGGASVSYTGSFTNLKFMLFKDLDNIKPLSDFAEIALDDVIFDQDDGIEDMGDIAD